MGWSPADAGAVDRDAVEVAGSPAVSGGGGKLADALPVRPDGHIA